MKFRTYVLFFLLFGVLADVILCLTLLKAPLWKVAVCLPTLAAGLCLPLIGTGRHYTPALRVFSYLIFIFEFPKFLTALIGLASATAGIIAGMAVSLFFITLIFFVTRHLKVRNTTLELPGWQGDPLRICFMADLHMGSFGQAGPYIQKIVDTVNAQKPDVILFGGDLVNFEAREAFSYRDILSGLEAPVYSILGNHDFLLHGPNDNNEEARRQDMVRLEEFEKSLGWRVLRNENLELRRGVSLIGVDNITKNPYFRKVGGNLPKAMEGVPEGNVKILLSHDPTHWRLEVLPGTDIDLTLSGHTHGLRYKLTGLHPHHWRLRESSGLYEEGPQKLFVTAGLSSAFAFRLGGYPKVDIITLKPR